MVPCRLLITRGDMEGPMTLEEMKAKIQIEATIGAIKYRPPMGKPEDRMLALATDTGEKIAVPSAVQPVIKAA
jgi:hypothetical protein